ncbi:MAG: hypothetical protein ABIP93_05055 [Gemmatimonadaceae bacterium]
MKRHPRLCCAALCSLFPLTSFAQGSPPAAPVRPVVDTYHGVRVTDPYRWMETPNNAELREWMLAQNAHTRAVLDAIPGRDSLLARQARYLGSTVTSIRLDDQRGDYAFMLIRRVGEEVRRYYVRDGLYGTDRLLLDPSAVTVPGRSTARGAAEIEGCVPSPSGRRLACQLAVGGSEKGALFIVDVATGRLAEAPIPRARRASWLPDEQAFVYSRRPESPSDAPPAQHNLNMRVYLHRIGTDSTSDRVLFGPGVSPDIDVDPAHYIDIRIPLGSTHAFARNNDGTTVNDEIFTAPVASLNAAVPVPWRRIIHMDDEVTAYAAHGDDLYVLSYHRAPAKRLLRTSLAAPNFSAAAVVVPESAGVIDGMTRRADALYLHSIERGMSRLRRVPFDGSLATDVPTAVRGRHLARTGHGRNMAGGDLHPDGLDARARRLPLRSRDAPARHPARAGPRSARRND